MGEYLEEYEKIVNEQIRERMQRTGENVVIATVNWFKEVSKEFAEIYKLNELARKVKQGKTKDEELAELLEKLKKVLCK